MTGPLGEGQEKTWWWKKVSTDGDFMTNSKTFVEVPGTRVVYPLDRAETVEITLQAVVHMGRCQVGMRIDGRDQSYVDVLGIPKFAGKEYLYPVALRAAERMEPGVHSAVMVMRETVGRRIWEGPKEWSPRNRPPGSARLSRSPAVPVILKVAVMR